TPCTEPLSSPRRLLAILAQLQARDLVAVDFVRAVGEAQDAGARPLVRERKVLAHPAAAVKLDRPVEHLQRHVRRRHLDHGDLAARGLVADGIHHVGRLQHQQPRLLDADARSGDALARYALLGERLAERSAAAGALAHHLERALGRTDEPHAVVDPAGAEAALRDLEAAALAEKNVLLRHAHVLVYDVAV